MKKEYFTVKNLLLCFAILVGVVMISVSAAITLTISTEFGDASLNTIIWGSTTGTLAGTTVPMKTILGIDKLSGNAFGIMGVIFPLVAALLLFTVFFNKNDKINKIVILTAAAFMLVGGIFQFLIVPGFVGSLVVAWGSGSESLAENIASSTRLSGGSIACGIITILAALGAGAVPFVPHIQLIK